MADWSKLPACEKRRVSHCRGCIYLGNCNSNAVCDYLEITGTRRGCPPGAGCTKKQVRERHYTPRQTTRVYTVSWDVEKGRELLENPELTPAEITKIMGVPYERIRGYGAYHGWNNPRTVCCKPRINWDEPLIRRMWEEGESFTAIGNAINAKCCTVRKWCAERGMFDHNRKKKTRVTWDVELGHKMYLEGRTVREIAEAVGKSTSAIKDYIESHWKEWE